MRTYRQQLASLLSRKDNRGATGQITARGYPSEDRCSVVAEIFGADGKTRTYHLVRAERLAVGR